MPLIGYVTLYTAGLCVVVPLVIRWEENDCLGRPLSIEEMVCLIIFWPMTLTLTLLYQLKWVPVALVAIVNGCHDLLSRVTDHFE